MDPRKMDAAATVLLVEPDPQVVSAMARGLEGQGYATVRTDATARAVELLRAAPAEVVVTATDEPGCDGYALLSFVKANRPETVVIFVAADGPVESAVRAVRQGAFDYLHRPVGEDDLLLSVDRAAQHQQVLADRLRAENASPRGPVTDIVGADRRMMKVFELIDRVADSIATVLITGESGTGKSLVARAIHHRSGRRDGPFVEVSCGALPEMLLETELFGHVKGAFTDAVGDRVGRFAAAEGGTIFLDEISAASPALQVKLLHVLQERRFEPVGSEQTVTADVRVILASNRDLWSEVEAGRFRRDLYYRVNVVNIPIPPLRERVGDIPLLAGHFLEQYRLANGKLIGGFSEEAVELMCSYPWPGNVRELENCVERAVVLCRTGRIEPADLPESVTGLAAFLPDYGPSPAASPGGRRTPGRAPTLAEALARPEKEIIRSALAAHGGSRKRAAGALGIDRTTLYKKMKKYGLLGKP